MHPTSTDTAATAARAERISADNALAATSEACVAWGLRPREVRLRAEIVREPFAYERVARTRFVERPDAWVLRIRAEAEQGSLAIVTQVFADLRVATALLDEVGQALDEWLSRARCWRIVTTLTDREGRTEHHDRRVWARDYDEAERLAPVVLARQIDPVSESVTISEPAARGVRSEPPG